MTLLLNLRLKNAIVMSADTRSTISDNTEHHGWPPIQHFDYTKKLFDWNGIGISFHGETATEMVADFLSECGTTKYDLFDFVDTFHQFIGKEWSPKDYTGFYVCGIEGSEYRIWYLNSKGQKELLSWQVGSLFCAGEIDTYNRLIATVPEGENTLDTKNSRYPLADFSIDEAADFCRFVTKSTHLSQMFLRGNVTVGPHAEVLVITPYSTRWHNTSIYHL